jgi:hypothetical protein
MFLGRGVRLWGYRARYKGPAQGHREAGAQAPERMAASASPAGRDAWRATLGVVEAVAGALAAD